MLTRILGAFEDEAVAVVDAASGVFVHVSRDFSAQVGYAPEDLVGKSVSFVETRFPDEDYWATHIADLTERPRAVLAMHRRRDGTLAAGEIVEHRVVDRDRTFVVAVLHPLPGKFPAMIEKLSESETRFRHLFECANDAIFIIDRGTNVLVEANRRATELFGYSRHELLQKTIHELLHEESAARIPEVRARLDAGNGTPYEMICVRQNGELRTAEASSCATTMSGRRCVLAIYRDITDRKNLEAQLEAQAKRLERMNAELNAFASMAAHDLKAPLQTMRGFSQLLERRLGPLLGEQERGHLQSIGDASRRMARLIEDLLEYALHDGEAASTNVVDAKAVLDETLDSLAAAVAESGATIERRNLFCLRMAHTHLLQVFQNLIGNAIKFRRPDVPSCIVVSATRAGARVIYRIEDNGIGVPEAQRERIFRPFVRLEHSETSGSGLGLATCRRVVERYGGQIHAEACASGGVAFVFDLPAAAAAPCAAR